MYLDQFSSPIILPELQYPLEADSSEEGIQFAILFELSARYESSANVPPHVARSPPCLEHHKKTHHPKPTQCMGLHGWVSGS